MTFHEHEPPHEPTVIEFFAAKLRKQYPVFFPSALSVPIHHQRMDIMQSRIRAIAWLLAFAIPLWSFIDAFVFPEDVWVSVLTSRLLAGAAFGCFLLIGNALVKKGTVSFWAVHAQLAIIFTIPILFYTFCDLPLDPSAGAHPFAAAVAFSYYLLPFIVLTGIGIFPLTLLESACYAVPLLIATAAANFYFPHTHSPLSGIGTIWIMSVVAVISMLTSLSQLRLLINVITYAAYDLLTDCLSRRSGEKILETLWNYSVRRKSNLSVAFIDLDRFKSVNDTFGHRAGDIILSNAAACIKQAVRESDFVIRWGGEEFLVILADADIDSASAVITRLCRAGFGDKPDGKPQTASVGLAERISDNISEIKKLIELADKRLYQAKEAGRNCCIGAKIVMLR